MSLLIDIIVSAFILIGSVFLFVGSFGLFKLPDTMRRLHGPTKATTLGIGALLIASILYFALLGQAFGIHEVLITLFLLTAFMISKAHIFRNKPTQQSLPAPKDSGWATLTKPR